MVAVLAISVARNIIALHKLETLNCAG